MSLLSSIFSWIKAIFKKIIDWVIDFIKEYWVVILIAAVIWFAPAIGAYLASAGAPAWLTTAFTWVGTTITPYLASGLSAIWSFGSSVATAAWGGFTGAGIATQLGIIAGVGMLLAPDETLEVITEAGSLAGEIIYSVGSAVASSSGLSTALWVGAGVGLLWLFLSRSGKDKEKDGKDEQLTTG